MTKCARITATGDIIRGNYEKPANYALNRVKSYLDLVIKTTCRCHPLITLSKHSEVESSRVCQSTLSNHLLRQENATVENFELPACTTVRFNMDEYNTTNGLCNGILLVAFNALNSSTMSDLSQHTLECFMMKNE